MYMIAGSSCGVEASLHASALPVGEILENPVEKIKHTIVDSAHSSQKFSPMLSITTLFPSTYFVLRTSVVQLLFSFLPFPRDVLLICSNIVCPPPDLRRPLTMNPPPSGSEYRTESNHVS